MDSDVLLEFINHPGFELYSNKLKSLIKEYEGRILSTNLDEKRKEKRWSDEDLDRMIRVHMLDLLSQPLVHLESIKYSVQENPELMSATQTLINKIKEKLGFQTE